MFLAKKEILKKIEKRLQRDSRIYIIPTRQGGYFLGIVFLLFMMSLTYGHSLAFTSTFIMISIFMTSAAFTNYNLSGLEFDEFILPAFLIEGESLEKALYILNKSNKIRFDLEFSLQSIQVDEMKKVAPGEKSGAVTRLSQLKPGKYKIPWLRMKTTFPFGLFRAWRFYHVNRYLIVLPKVAPMSLDQMESENEIGPADQAVQVKLGEEEYADSRRYEMGDPLKRINWKLYAKNQQLQTKIFQTEERMIKILKDIKLTNMNEVKTFLGVGETLLKRDGAFIAETTSRDLINAREKMSALAAEAMMKWQEEKILEC